MIQRICDWCGKPMDISTEGQNEIMVIKDFSGKPNLRGELHLCELHRDCTDAIYAIITEDIERRQSINKAAQE